MAFRVLLCGTLLNLSFRLAIHDQQVSVCPSLNLLQPFLKCIFINQFNLILCIYLISKKAENTVSTSFKCSLPLIKAWVHKKLLYVGSSLRVCSVIKQNQASEGQCCTRPIHNGTVQIDLLHAETRGSNRKFHPFLTRANFFLVNLCELLVLKNFSKKRQRRVYHVHITVYLLTRFLEDYGTPQWSCFV